MTATLGVLGLEIPWAIRTFEGFREWVATLDEHAPRVHFHAGRVLIDVPHDCKNHAPVVRAINRCLDRLVVDLDLGHYFGPPSWLTVEEVELSTEPDGFLVRWESWRQGVVRVNPERGTELLGRPDMALEVVSKTSEQKDLRELVVAYAKAGVREYWIGDARGAEPCLRILRLGARKKYKDVVPDADGFLASPTFGRSFRLRRLIDKAGLVDYQLEVKASA
jgi:Uma2 family endonuclease